MMNLDSSVKQHIFEIFEDVAKAKTKDEAVGILQKHTSYGLRSVLKGAFDPKVKWLVDDTIKYVAAEEGAVPTTLIRQVEKFKYLVFFYKGPNTQYNSLRQEKREQLFKELLEGVHPKDAKILLEMTRKNGISYKNVNATTAKLAFPDLWSDEEEKQSA